MKWFVGILLFVVGLGIGYFLFAGPVSIEGVVTHLEPQIKDFSKDKVSEVVKKDKSVDNGVSDSFVGASGKYAFTVHHPCGLHALVDDEGNYIHINNSDRIFKEGKEYSVEGVIYEVSYVDDFIYGSGSCHVLVES